jgi:[1-hydroxy-2-(trimethylamino)ethyl]phosphonate dioxygenase
MERISSVYEVFELLAKGGGAAYFGEPVTVLEHCLQAAWFVQRKGGENTLIAAGLLHDLGHLLHAESEDVAEHGLDTRHEELAVAALGEHLPASVLDPIRLHVAAKRYLCFADAAYLAELSPASVTSLGLQGGPMSAAEAEAFLSLPHARESITLRRADDAAKMPGLEVPQLEGYRGIVEALWR